MSNTINNNSESETNNSEIEANRDLLATTSNSQELKQNDVPKMKPLKLWISSEWFIPIDNKGMCIGTCFEGALGFVIQLKSERGSAVALKLPRLMGETYRENAYINELMEKELWAVKEVFEGEPIKVNPEKLLAFFGAGELRGLINTAGGNENAKKWHNSLVFVHYKKGQNPQFCLVKYDEKTEKVEIFPPESKCPIKSDKEYKMLIENRKSDQGKDWAETILVACEKSDDIEKNELEIFSINKLKNQDKEIWYTSIPSIKYGWAPGTLQQTISCKQRGEWKIKEHLDLAERLCQGLDALHSKEMLHADLRPANVVYRGDETSPDNYFLADYGSFARKTPYAAGNSTNLGQTIIGPAIGGERTSPFYAPERCLGREREEADIAIVYPDVGDSLYIILGWRSELINPQSNKPDQEKIKSLIEQNLDQENREDDSKTLLDKGDRIQVREFIFEVEEIERNVENKQILKCNTRVWKIYQNRIVVRYDDTFEDMEWFPIPRTIELLQWSVATDIYSLGAVILYSVFYDSTHIAERNRKENSSQIEEEFRQMLNYLSSPPYFNSIWSEIEELRIQLERHLENDNLSPTQFANTLYINPGTSTDEPEIDPIHPIEEENNTIEYTTQKKKDQKTLQEKVIEISSLITQTVPGARWLISTLNYDLGRFIFFIHFIFCCLHRRSELQKETDMMNEFPFCANRLESPNENGAAYKAKQRLKFIKEKIIIKGALNSLIFKSKDIPEFEPRPDTILSLELIKSEKKREEIKNIIKEFLGEEDFPLNLFVKRKASIEKLKNDLQQIEK